MTAAGLVPDESRRRRLGERLGPRSLTARLVTGVVALVVVLVALIGGGTWFALRYFLDQRLDQQLQSTVSNASLQQILSQSNENGAVPPPTDIWLVVLNPSDGSFIGYASLPGLEPMKLTDSQRLTLIKHAGTDSFTLTTRDGQRLLVTTRTVRIDTAAGAPGPPLELVIGLSTDEEHRTLHQLFILEFVIGAAAVVIAWLATLYGVRFSLRRLRQVTTTANEVAAELSPTGTGLDRRVEVEDDTTEVGQLAQSMNTLLSAVETQFAARLESEARLRQFLADASHELRTPLTSIRGYAELARMQRAAGEAHDDNLSRIESEGTRMSRLVEDLLMLARGDRSGEPVIELIDVAELVDDAVAGTRAAFPDRQIDVESAAGLHVVGDHDQLLRAVRNLMTNAAVHTASERPIRATSALQGDSVVIQIIDGGPGLPADEAAHVFERFWRADKARSRARGGSGLGMSIVASIVAANHGAVYFDSSVEHGSTATIVLPAISD
jgi:two-component system OmpR family sensor kinase